MRIICFLIVIFNVLTINAQADLDKDFPIIPRPQSIQVVGGQFDLRLIQTLVVPVSSPEAIAMGEMLQQILKLPGLKVQKEKKIEKPKGKSITMSLLKKELPSEYYKISITKNGIWIQAVDPKGWFYGIQTLAQLYELRNGVQSEQTLPFCLIEDQPRFSYRGLHLDVSRHFFPVAFIKKYIETMARFKFNYFHWHLTDDQGWRIEIKKFPKLHEWGSVRKATLKGHAGEFPPSYDSVEYKGYYTQDEIREIIAFGKEHFVEIIPEIEMPGHSTAALSAYPEFSCSGEAREVAGNWGVFESGIYCTQDTSLWFVKEILSEVCDLFPGKYIHVGGDEVPKNNWKKCTKCQGVKRRNNLKTEEDLQSYFIRNIERHVNAKGKVLIGWDEILEGGLPANAVVMSWRGMEGAIAAAKSRHASIVCPGSHCYFDHYQSLNANEPLAIGGFTSLQKTYSFEPVPVELKANERSYVLGAQGNVWTEYMATEDQVLYMAYPRAMALAEVNWTDAPNKSYPSFIKRLQYHIPWAKAEGLQITQSMLDLDYRTAVGSGTVELAFIKPPLDGKILVESSRDGDVISQYLSKDTFILDKTIAFKAWYQLQGGYIGKALRIDYEKHLASGKKIDLLESPAAKYFTGGSQSLINGLSAPSNKYGGPEWVGLEGKDFKAILDLQNPEQVQQIKLQFYHEPGSWIHKPQEIEIQTSLDGNQYSPIKKFPVIGASAKCIETEIALGAESIRYIQITVRNHGIIADGLPGAGHKAWLFVGEIKVK